MAIRLPATMRALTHDYAKQKLALANVPVPKPDLAAGEHLIKVFTVGLVSTELLWPRPPELNLSFPGVDVVGRILSAPPTSKFQPDAVIFARTTYPRGGSAREYSIVTEEEIALAPKSVSYTEAAAVPVSALTSWQILFEHLGYPPPTLGQAQANKSLRILVNGASGGVGIWAVQLAHLTGAYVVGVTSSANADLVRSLGADEIIDYKKQPPRAWAEEDPSRRVDVVFDCVGRAAAEPVWHTLRENGRFVTIVPPADMKWKWDLDTPADVASGVKGTFFLMHPSGEDLGHITEFIDAGHCRAVVDSCYSLEEGVAAFERVDSGRTIGKVVLKVTEE